MELTIDRRQNRALFWFLLRDPEFFEDFSGSENRDYRDIIESLVPLDWTKRATEIWLHALPPEAKLPLQGFKIHLSATSATAAELLRRIVPLCVANKAAFKIMADPLTLEVATCKHYWRGGSGKFITVYPRDDEHFCGLIAAFDAETKDLAGPYILSDKRYGDSKVLFYRYGGFARRAVLNVFGEKVMVIEAGDGRLVPDVRSPFFHLPDGIEDPLSSREPNPEADGEICLNNRYRVTAMLTQSNAGGVYMAEDQLTGQTVIIKEARPLVNVARGNNQDAIATLRKEARILRKLKTAGCVPKLIDLFQEWEHLFLVEEYVEGLPLSSFRALKDIALVLRNAPDTDTVRTFCAQFYTVVHNLVEALQACHREGVVIGDLSPYNILIKPDTLDLTLIDFEAAQLLGETESSGFVVLTPGFASSNRMKRGELSPQDDFYSLGSVIYSLLLPVQELFPLSPAAEALFIDEITLDFRLPHTVKEIIFALTRGETHHALALIEAGNADRLELSPAVERDNFNLLQIPEVVSGISDYILTKADLSRQDRLWPSDYRVFATNPLSLAYGATGTALFLKTALGELPQDILQWLDERTLSLEQYPPGLFVGLSGIAWVLDHLGLTRRARTAIDLALQSPILHDGPDMFYGAAGTGLASLYFFHRTGEEQFLKKARELGDSLISKASVEGDECYWSNVDRVAYLGYAHGGSGIALFLLYLHLTTGETRYLSYASRALEYEISQANAEGRGLAWGRVKGDSQDSPYWGFGTSGVGSALIRFYRHLGDGRYRDLAEKAARSAAGKYTVLPSQFLGLSGIGEFLIDMYHFTGEHRYLDDAWKVAEGVLLFQIRRPEGIAFPGEGLLRISTDYGTGSAGVGMFLQRLIHPAGRMFYELDAQLSVDLQNEHAAAGLAAPVSRG